MSANERNKEEIRQEREKWNNWKEGADMDRLVFLDETGVRTNFAPRYGWSLRGHPCRGETPAGWKSYSIASAIRLKGVVQSTTVEGAFKKESFREYMEDILLPSLKRGDIVIMDNLSIHKNSFDKKKFKRRGIEIRYLPRYSPDQNPIELMWAKIKTIIRKACARNGDEIWEATNESLWTVTPKNIEGWFRGCGYFH